MFCMTKNMSLNNYNQTNSHILNGDNYKKFEKLIVKTDNMVLKYRYSDCIYNMNLLAASDTNPYIDQLCDQYMEGLNNNIVVLIKTEEGRVFGFYITRETNYFRPNDRDPIYFFSLDTCSKVEFNYEYNDYVEFDFHEYGLIAKFNDYNFTLIDHEQSSKVIAPNTNEAKNIFGGIYHDLAFNNRFVHDIPFEEIEIYQVINIQPQQPIKTSILSSEEQNLYDKLIPYKKLRVIEAVNDDGRSYANYSNDLNHVHNFNNIVFLIKTVSNHIFGIYHTNRRSYIYSVSLNEMFPLTDVDISINLGARGFTIESDELYLSVSSKDNTGCFESYNNIDDEITLNEVIGHNRVSRNPDYLYSNMREFTWLEFEVYEVSE